MSETSNLNDVLINERAIGAALARPSAVMPDGKTYLPVIAPGGALAYQGIDDGKPKQIAESPVFHVADDFARYVNLYRDQAGAKTLIFADLEAAPPVVTACLDYHASAETPRLRKHNATLLVPLDPAWAIWMAASNAKQAMTQKDFVAFIEQNVGDIIGPVDPTALLERVSDIELHSNARMKQKRNPNTSEVTIVYEETIEEKVKDGSFTLPKHFDLKIPVFFGEEPRPIKVHLRIIANRGEEIGFKLEIHRAAEEMRKAFLAITTRIGDLTAADNRDAIVPLLGKPGR